MAATSSYSMSQAASLQLMEGADGAFTPGSGQGMQSEDDLIDNVEIAAVTPSNPCAFFLQYGIIVLIMVSTGCVIAETVPEWKDDYAGTFKTLERLFTCVFTIEIIVRIYGATDRCHYCISMANIIDVLATLPWYIEHIIGYFFSSLENEEKDEVAESFWTLRMVRVVRMVRLMRVLRLAKALRHFEVITVVIESVHASANGLIALMAFTLMGTVFSATVAFFLESEEPESQFRSIPASMWWALAAVTGVGYGDMVPSTIGGKITSAAAMIGGMIITSVSSAIITTSFMEQYQRKLRVLEDQQLEGELQADSQGYSPFACVTKTVVRCQEPQVSTNGRVTTSTLSSAGGTGAMALVTRLEDELKQVMTSFENMSTKPLPQIKDVYVSLTDRESTTDVSKLVDSDSKAAQLEMLREQGEFFIKQLRSFAKSATRTSIRQGSKESLHEK